MKKGEIINGYKILEDFKVAGGMSKISFCQKGGNNYFIKEFLSPKYPLDSSPGSAKIKARKREKCLKFENHHNKINGLLSEKCAHGGNLVFAINFFRSGTTYYKINEKIDVSSIPIESVCKLPAQDILLICKTVCHSLKILHNSNIIHGDIKPDNVLIKKTKTSSYTSKLIDFDNSFFDSNPPLNIEDIVGDQVYYSPELAKYILGAEDVNEKMLTTKSDIYALGLLIHQYVAGHLPFKPTEEINYPWQLSINKSKLNDFDKRIPDPLQSLIEKMIKVDYTERPTIGSVFDSLKSISKQERFKNAEKPIIDIIADSPKPKLGGKLLGKDKKSTFKRTEKEVSSKSKLKGKLIR